MTDTLKFACIGLDHRHIYEMTAGILSVGGECAGYYTSREAEPLAGFIERFPKIPRIAEMETLLEDESVQLILCAAIPNERAKIATEAMRRGKDFMVDKPGMTTLDQLKEVRKVQADTGARYSIDFSEHFQVPATLKAKELIDQGAIGQVIQTVGLGPHRLNRQTRPPWFFQKKHYGGILIDIASHQIEQFLWLTNSEDAEIVSSAVGNFANDDDPELEDFGEILIRSAHATGYIRVDWYTPNALSTWGDGRLFIQGTEGSLELRKYIDVAGKEGTDHVILVNRNQCERVDCDDVEITYFEQFKQDILNRTENTMTHEHCFKVCELALKAQNQAVPLGKLKQSFKSRP